MRRVVALCLAAALTATPAPAPALAMDKTDAFVAAAAQSNMSEIELSKLALQKSQDARVRAFAQRIIDDHTQTGTKLAVVARQEHTALPDALDADHSATVADLSSRTSDFDRAYIDAMAADHTAAVALFSDYASNGSDLYLKNFARHALPTLTTHKALIGKLKARR